MADYNSSPISPYPYTAEQQALLRRRQLAQLLQEQAMAPVEEPSVRGANVNVMQGIAKMVQALMAGRVNRQLDTQQQGLNARIQTERSRQALEMARAMMPQAQGTTANLPMAPTQAMPVPSTLTPQDAAAQQLPGSAPYTPPMPAPVTPEGPRSIPIPASSQSIGQLHAFANALASFDPTQQEYARAQMGDIFAGQRATRQEGFEAMQKALDRGLEQQKITNAQANYLSEAAHRSAQEKIAQELEQKPKPMILPEGGQMMMVGPEGQMTPGPQGSPKPETPHTVVTEQGVFQWNPKTNKYDIRIGDRPQPAAALNNVPQDDATVKYMADQVEDNPLNWNMTGGNRALQNQVRQELATRGRDTNRLTQATRQLGETADTIVPKMDATIKRLDDPKVIANLGPVMGRWNEFMTGKIGTNDQDLANLRATLGMLATGTMRAHVGARGGETLLNKFQGLMDGSKMDASTLKGSMTGVRDFLQGYRDKIHPRGSGSQAPSGSIPAVGGTFNGGKVLKVTPVP